MSKQTEVCACKMSKQHPFGIEWTREGLYPVIEDLWKKEAGSEEHIHCEKWEAGYIITPFELRIRRDSPSFQNTDKTVAEILANTQDLIGPRHLRCIRRAKDNRDELVIKLDGYKAPE
jgi:hypothetical protein